MSSSLVTVDSEYIYCNGMDKKSSKNCPGMCFILSGGGGGGGFWGLVLGVIKKHLYISGRILKLYFFLTYCAFSLVLTIYKCPFHADFYENNLFFSHVVALSNLRVLTACDLLISYKLIAWIFRKFKHLKKY